LKDIRLGVKQWILFFRESGTFVIAMAIAVFMFPLVTLFQPVRPVAFSLTLILTGYICITVRLDPIYTPAERGELGLWLSCSSYMALCTGYSQEHKNIAN
jgi:hypothetical protein